jgi:hypothetical protein
MKRKNLVQNYTLKISKSTLKVVKRVLENQRIDIISSHENHISYLVLDVKSFLHSISEKKIKIAQQIFFPGGAKKREKKNVIIFFCFLWEFGLVNGSSVLLFSKSPFTIGCNRADLSTHSHIYTGVNLSSRDPLFVTLPFTLPSFLFLKIFLMI